MIYWFKSNDSEQNSQTFLTLLVGFIFSNKESFAQSHGSPNSLFAVEHTHGHLYTYAQADFSWLSHSRWTTGLSCLCENSSCSHEKRLSTVEERWRKKLIPSFSLCLPNSERWTLAVPCGGSQKRKPYCFSRDVSSMLHLQYTLHGCVKFTQTYTLSCNGLIMVNGSSKVDKILNGWCITACSRICWLIYNNNVVPLKSTRV